MKQELFSLLKKMPQFVFDALAEYLSGEDDINEIRLRANRPISICISGINKELERRVSKEELGLVLNALCDGSVYSRYESIMEGFISFDDGVRVGVCGKAYCEGGKIKSVSDISSLNIRIPSKIYGISGAITDRLARRNFSESVLLFSAPGGGKTTMLRDIAKSCATKYAKRVVVVDSRCELADSVLESSANIDILYGYPKDKGIEIATRTMSAQVIICDEIGGRDDAQSLLYVQNAGVCVVASAHASSITQLMSRKSVSMLHKEHIFDLYVGIRRKAGSNKCDLGFFEWSELGPAQKDGGFY